MQNKFDSDEQFLYKPAVKEKEAIPVWLCFPSTYAIGMCSLGYLSIFKILDEKSFISPERIFTDTEKTIHNPNDVKMMGFSFSFELDFLNIFKTLQKYNIPLRACDRNENHPLIFGGGPVLSANPEPYAEFFDIITIGEGEYKTVDLINTYKNSIKSTKQEKIIELAQLSGVYTPSLYKITYNDDNTIQSFIKNIDNAPTSIEKDCVNITESMYSPILTGKAVFSNMFLVETARGCPKKCRFCIASYLTLPARYPQYESIINTINTGLKYTAKIGLLGALITEHPDFDRICEFVINKRKETPVELSVSSLRADKISPIIIKTLIDGGQKSTTIAVEAGTDRLRKFINKHLSREQIFKAVKIARENGLSELKIYGIIGLPTETMADIEALANLMIELKKENPKFKLTLSISSFVPKAQTPFQWERREEIKKLQIKSDYLKKELMKHNIAFKPTSLKWDFIQSILSRGDRRLSYLLEKVYKYNGSLGSWGRSYKEILDEKIYDIPSLDWYGLRERKQNEILPWAFINTGLNKSTLRQDRDSSYKYKD